jgi:hypothetical protein
MNKRERKSKKGKTAQPIGRKKASPTAQCTFYFRFLSIASTLRAICKQRRAIIRLQAQAEQPLKQSLSLLLYTTRETKFNKIFPTPYIL